jgi:hypothetical protein
MPSRDPEKLEIECDDRVGLKVRNEIGMKMGCFSKLARSSLSGQLIAGDFTRVTELNEEARSDSSAHGTPSH